MDFSLDSIRALDAIVQEGSFAGAARALHKAQSAVSYSIRQLEDALDIELFDRSGHRAELTPAGRAVLDEGRVLLARARSIEGIARQFRQGWEPELNVVVDGILPMEPIMRVLQRMADEGAPTIIQIRVEFLGGVQDRFERDRADIMLVKEYQPRDDLIAHALPEVECVLVCAPGHPLAAAPDGGWNLTDLQGHVELTVHDSSDSKRFDDVHLFGGSRVFYLADFASKEQALRMGMGFGWMPLYAVADALNDRELVPVEYVGGSRYRFIPRLVHPAARPLGIAGKRFLELVDAEIEEAGT